MVKQEMNIPQIRFKGFSVDWRGEYLGDIAKVTMGQSPDSVNYTENPSDYILVQGNADLQNGEVVPRVYTTQLTKRADKGDIILTVRAPVGALAFTNFDVVLGRGVAGIKGNSFIYYSLELANALKSWEKFSSGSTFDSINSADIKGFKLLVPDQKEQTAIGNFFQQIDKLIKLQTRAVETAEIYKKAMLQKMFPQKGEKVPRVRFAGFSGDWEEKKVGEVSDSYSGGTPSVDNRDYYNNGNIPFIRSGEISKDKTELFITELGLENSSAKLVDKGDILYALYGATSGEVARSKIKGAINQAILAIFPHEKYNSEYLTQTLSFHKELILSVFLQGGQGNLSGTIIKSLKLLFPSYEEQTAIGNFFQKLDQQIEQHAQKLATYQQLKKAMLQRMFV